MEITPEHVRIGMDALVGALIGIWGIPKGIRWYIQTRRNGNDGDEKSHCPDHKCHETVVLSAHAIAGVQEGVKDIKGDLRRLFDSVDDMRRDTAFIKGKMETQK